MENFCKVREIPYLNISAVCLTMTMQLFKRVLTRNSIGDVSVKKILIVDDEPDTVQLIKSILEMHGFSVETASNGKECLQKVKTKKTDLVLLDIMMPDMSGWEVFNKLKKSEAGARVIFVSVVEITPERKQSLMKEGLIDYINKPFTKDDLMEKVKKAMEAV